MFVLVCWLGFGTLQRSEKTALVWEVYKNTKSATLFAVYTVGWLHRTVSASSVAECKETADPTTFSTEAISPNSTSPRSPRRIDHYIDQSERKGSLARSSPEMKARQSPKLAQAELGDGPAPTPSVDELLKQYGLKPTLDGYQEASALRHELTRKDISKYGYWLTPKGQKRVEPSTMPKYF